MSSRREFLAALAAGVLFKDARGAAEVGLLDTVKPDIQRQREWLTPVGQLWWQWDSFTFAPGILAPAQVGLFQEPVLKAPCVLRNVSMMVAADAKVDDMLAFFGAAEERAPGALGYRCRVSYKGRDLFRAPAYCMPMGGAGIGAGGGMFPMDIEPQLAIDSPDDWEIWFEGGPFKPTAPFTVQMVLGTLVPEPNPPLELAPIPGEPPAGLEW